MNNDEIDIKDSIDKTPEPEVATPRSSSFLDDKWSELESRIKKLEDEMKHVVHAHK